MVAMEVGKGVLVAVGSGVQVAVGKADWVSTAARVTSKTAVCISCSRLGVGGGSVGVGVGGIQEYNIPKTTNMMRIDLRFMDKL